jgi:hypothetical protein
MPRQGYIRKHFTGMPARHESHCRLRESAPSIARMKKTSDLEILFITGEGSLAGLPSTRGH